MFKKSRNPVRVSFFCPRKRGKIEKLAHRVRMMFVGISRRSRRLWI